MTPPVPSPDHTAIVRAFFDALCSLDPQRIAALFAEDGEIEDPLGSDVCRGRADIEAHFARGLATMFSHLEIDTIAAFSAGSGVAAHWSMRARDASGREGSGTGIDVFRVNARGEITRLEGYWRPSDGTRDLSSLRSSG